MARTISVEILGDSTSVERAFARSAKAAQKFKQDVGGAGVTSTLNRQAEAVKSITAAEQDLIRVRSRKASSIGPFRVAGVGLGAGLGLFAATQAVRELGDRLETTGQAAFTTEGRLKNMASALTRGNLVGAFEALRRVPQTLEEIGFSAALGRDRIAALREVAAGMPSVFGNMAGGAQAYSEAMDRQRAIIEAAGTANRELAQAQLDLIASGEQAAFMFDLMADAASRMGQQFLSQAGAVVTFKGAVDDLVRAGRGEFVGGPPSPPRRAFHPSIGPLSPSQRRELDLIGKEAVDRIPLLQDRLRQLNNQLADFHGNQEQRLKILTNVRNTEAEIAGIYKDQAAARRASADAAAAEAKRAADAARRAVEALKDRAAAIKSALLSRLGDRQTDVLNRRALRDAKEQLRVARLLGGPKGTRLARERLQDVRFDMLRAQIERAPASLTAGGRFALGNIVTINVHGVTDPEAVARKVAEVLQRRRRHTTTQTRGPAAGTAAGAH
jgi:hypothetical protein